MDKFLVASIILAFPLVTFGASCTETTRSIFVNPAYEKQNPDSLKELSNLSNQLGPGQKKEVTEQSFTWKTSKGGYTIVVRDGVTISATDQGMHPDFGKRKFPSLEVATKELGKPELGPIKKIVKTSWACQDTHSSIALYSDESGKIISLVGKYCPSSSFSEDCVTFGNKG